MSQVLGVPQEVEITSDQYDAIIADLDAISAGIDDINDISLHAIEGVLNGIASDLSKVHDASSVATNLLSDILGDVDGVEGLLTAIAQNQTNFLWYAGKSVARTSRDTYEWIRDIYEDHLTPMHANSDAMTSDLDDIHGWGTPDTGEGIRVQVANWDDMGEVVIGGYEGAFNESWSFGGFSSNSYDDQLAGAWTNITGAIGPQVEHEPVTTNAESWTNPVPSVESILTQNPVWTVAMPRVTFTAGSIGVTTTNAVFDWSQISGVSTFRSFIVFMLWGSLAVSILAWARGTSAEQEV